MSTRLTGEESAHVNRVLAEKYLKPQQLGKKHPTQQELAYELGLATEVVEQRLSRIRRGIVQVLPPPCDCDDSGPCLQHFVPPAEGV